MECFQRRVFYKYQSPLSFHLTLWPKNVSKGAPPSPLPQYQMLFGLSPINAHMRSSGTSDISLH